MSFNFVNSWQKRTSGIGNRQYAHHITSQFYAFLLYNTIQHQMYATLPFIAAGPWP